MKISSNTLYKAVKILMCRFVPAVAGLVIVLAMYGLCLITMSQYGCKGEPPKPTPLPHEIIERLEKCTEIEQELEWLLDFEKCKDDRSECQASVAECRSIVAEYAKAHPSLSLEMTVSMDVKDQGCQRELEVCQDALKECSEILQVLKNLPGCDPLAELLDSSPNPPAFGLF